MLHSLTRLPLEVGNVTRIDFIGTGVVDGTTLAP